MKVVEITQIRDKLNKLVVEDKDKAFFVTLKFPDPSMDLYEADKILKAHLDVIRKAFPDAYILSTMAFSEDGGVGVHFHNLIVNRGYSEVIKNGQRHVPDEDADGLRFMRLQENEIITALEQKVRTDWRKRVQKISRYKNQNLRDVVQVQKAELASGSIRDYITRIDEKYIPHEWRKSRIKWFKERGTANFWPATSVERFLAA
jgi:hypothetical protein